MLSRSGVRVVFVDGKDAIFLPDPKSHPGVESFTAGLSDRWVTVLASIKQEVGPNVAVAVCSYNETIVESVEFLP